MTALSQEQRRRLTRTERAALRLGELYAGPLKPASMLWLSTTMSAVAWGIVGRRVRFHGLEHVADLRRDDRVVLVANHRSFFDFYALHAAMLWKTRTPRRAFFPVRASFFYDAPAGMVLNLAMSGMSMFPPIFRDRPRWDLNLFGLDWCVEALQRPGTLLGMHPEGTRNKGPNPYELLPARPGVGRIILSAPGARVIPVFVHGLTNDLDRELAGNWRRPEESPVNLVFGPELGFDDLRAVPRRPALDKRASERCRAALTELGRREHALRLAQGVGLPEGGPLPEPPTP